MAAPVGRSCILPKFHYRSITAVDVSILRVDNEEFDRSFANYLCNSWIVRNQAENLAAGATRKRISRRNLQIIRVPFPPLVEQRGIAEVLSTVDECIRHTDEIIEKTEELKRGLMQQLLPKGIGLIEYKETPVGRIPETWKTLTLSRLVMYKNGIYKPEEFYGKGHPSIRMHKIVNGKVLAEGIYILAETGFYPFSIMYSSMS